MVFYLATSVIFRYTLSIFQRFNSTNSFFLTMYFSLLSNKLKCARVQKYVPIFPLFPDFIILMIFYSAWRARQSWMLFDQQRWWLQRADGSFQLLKATQVPVKGKKKTAVATADMLKTENKQSLNCIFRVLRNKLL